MNAKARRRGFGQHSPFSWDALLLCTTIFYTPLVAWCFHLSLWQAAACIITYFGVGLALIAFLTRLELPRRFDFAFLLLSVTVWTLPGMGILVLMLGLMSYGVANWLVTAL